MSWYPRRTVALGPSELEVLHLKCLQDFIQDGESVVYHGSHVATAVDVQYGSEGCVIPCTSRGSTPPVPQVQLAGHELPV